MRRPAVPPAGAAALASKAVGVPGARVSGPVQVRAEAFAQPVPGAVVTVGGLRRHHLHAHATVARRHERPGDGPVVEGPGGDPDRAVGRLRCAQRATRPSPDTADGQQHPVADRELLGLPAVGKAEVGPVGDHVALGGRTAGATHRSPVARHGQSMRVGSGPGACPGPLRLGLGLLGLPGRGGVDLSLLCLSQLGRDVNGRPHRTRVRRARQRQEHRQHRENRHQAGQDAAVRPGAWAGSKP